MNYRPQPPTQALKTDTKTITDNSDGVLRLDGVVTTPATLSEQQIFLALLTGAMAKSSVADYDAKGTAGKNRVKKLMEMAKSIAEVYHA